MLCSGNKRKLNKNQLMATMHDITLKRRFNLLHITLKLNILAEKQDMKLIPSKCVQAMYSEHYVTRLTWSFISKIGNK